MVLTRTRACFVGISLLFFTARTEAPIAREVIAYQNFTTQLYSTVGNRLVTHNAAYIVKIQNNVNKGIQCQRY